MKMLKNMLNWFSRKIMTADNTKFILKDSEKIFYLLMIAKYGKEIFNYNTTITAKNDGMWEHFVKDPAVFNKPIIEISLSKTISEKSFEHELINFSKFFNKNQKIEPLLKRYYVVISNLPLNTPLDEYKDLRMSLVEPNQLIVKNNIEEAKKQKINLIAPLNYTFLQLITDASTIHGNHFLAYCPTLRLYNLEENKIEQSIVNRTRDFTSVSQIAVSPRRIYLLDREYFDNLFKSSKFFTDKSKSEFVFFRFFDTFVNSLILKYQNTNNTYILHELIKLIDPLMDGFTTNLSIPISVCSSYYQTLYSYMNNDIKIFTTDKVLYSYKSSRTYQTVYIQSKTEHRSILNSTKMFIDIKNKLCFYKIFGNEYFVFSISKEGLIHREKFSLLSEIEKIVQYIIEFPKKENVGERKIATINKYVELA